METSNDDLGGCICNQSKRQKICYRCKAMIAVQTTTLRREKPRNLCQLEEELYR